MRSRNIYRAQSLVAIERVNAARFTAVVMAGQRPDLFGSRAVTLSGPASVDLAPSGVFFCFMQWGSTRGR